MGKICAAEIEVIENVCKSAGPSCHKAQNYINFSDDALPV